MPFNVIVVGTDGSERALIAVREALALAKMSGAKLHLLHVLSPISALKFANTAAAKVETDRVQEEAKVVKEQLVAEAERLGVPNASVETLFAESGDVADTLVGAAEKVNADLVVLGNRGMTGMKRFVLGSVPNAVAHRCPCSVLIVNTDLA
jgi:nucleotide-binding universal stress UspA family protein